jgi:hypothetical protein
VGEATKAAAANVGRSFTAAWGATVTGAQNLASTVGTAAARGAGAVVGGGGGGGGGGA